MNAPSHWSDDARFTESAAAFRAFFGELREAFVERDNLFTQLELALLCREHVLLIGPPGTAKSAIAAAVLGRIVDEASGRPSLFSKQLAENTVQTDLIGPVDFKVLTDTGRTEYLTEEGMLGAVHAFLDEVFDGRDMLLRSILNVLHERELKHGRKVTPGRCECAVMTSNRYLSEVLQRSPETLQAFADRISFICFAPKGFARRASRGQMLSRAQTGQRPSLQARLTLQQLDVLQAAVDAVEVPAVVAEGIEELADTLERELLAQVSKLPDYVPTKYFSQRSMVKALWALKAGVVRDRLYRRPERRLVAEPADLEMLRHFFLLGGPTEGDLDALLKGAADPRERAQLDIIRVEHRAFTAAMAKLSPTLQQSLDRENADLRPQEELSTAEGQNRNWTAAVASTAAISLRNKLVPGPRHLENRKVLLKAAEALVQGLSLRVGRGMSGQGEGRGGVTLLGSFGDVLELARRVPELQERLPELAREVAEFCRQSASMVALQGESAEFDDTMRIEAIATLAQNATEELERTAELVQVLSIIVPELAGPLREHLGAVRERTGAALYRRAVSGFSPAAKKMEALELLGVESRRLRELENLLVVLSPSTRGLRSQLLAPIAESYARDTVAVQPFERLVDFHRLVQAVVDNLTREGAGVQEALRAVREDLDRRVRGYAEGLATQKASAPDSSKVLTGEAYTYYRQHLAAHEMEGELAALTALDSLLSRLSMPPMPADIRALVAAAELHSAALRIRYLNAWWKQLDTTLGGAAAAKSKSDAQKMFDSLVKSRFPMLVTREGELVRLEGAIHRLSVGATSRPQALDTLSSELASLQTGFTSFSRQVLDVRARR
ncbi:MAG: AAA family ATPase [Archangium sp.]